MAWQRKMDNLCIYIATGKWGLRHERVPVLLVVTQDERNHQLIGDALGAAIRAHGVTTPAVFVAGWSKVIQHGPLADIWMPAYHETPGRTSTFSRMC